MQRKFEISKIKKIGWKNKTSFSEGIDKTVEWFIENQNNLREK